MSNRTLVLSPDNPSNTHLIDEDGKVLYFVNTEFPGNKTLTHVKDGDEEEIATLEWRDILSDKVTLKGQKQQSLSNWLHRGISPFSSTVTFKDPSGRKYRWENMSPGLSLQLFAEDHSDKEPIARFVKSHRAYDDKPARPAHLLLTPRAMEIRDDIVTSFLFLEKTRRANDNSIQNKADVLGTAAFSLKAIHNGGVGS